MTIYTARRPRYRRRGFARSYLASWLIPAGIIGFVLAAIWPLLAFRHHWTTTGQVPCWQNLNLPACANVPFGDVIATAPQTAYHSAPTGLGAGLTIGWIGFWFVLVMTGSVLGRRQKARRG
jgi:hypothetical protein